MIFINSQCMFEEEQIVVIFMLTGMVSSKTVNLQCFRPHVYMVSIVPTFCCFKYGMLTRQ